MNFLAYIFVYALIAAVVFAVISLLRVAYVHIKAYVIRRKLAKFADSETETKKDD